MRLQVRVMLELFQTHFALKLGLDAALVLQVASQVAFALVVRAAAPTSVPPTFSNKSRVARV